MEQERKLKDWLDSYKVADADSALLDRIVARAAATPQQTEQIDSRSWGSYATALAAVAVLGFWFGNASLSKPVSTLSSQQSFLSGKSYLNKIIFGPKTWQEVSL
ncbi:MAG: hypothetical protein P4M15_04240 [Alphaproteobacteria bacterium]|nr:hypothetical protein [Alphaproteobacteria bacterium]